MPHDTTQYSGSVTIKNTKYRRDLKSKAILQTDRDALNSYKNKMALERKIKKQDKEIQSLKSDIDEIKRALLRYANIHMLS